MARFYLLCRSAVSHARIFFDFDLTSSRSPQKELDRISVGNNFGTPNAISYQQFFNMELTIQCIINNAVN